MTDQPISTAPRSIRANTLEETFYETMAAQSDHLDSLARQLITLELAIPGLYATVLKLVSGSDVTIQAGWDTRLAFACWLIALGLTLWSLFPRNYTVDTTVLRRDSLKPQADLGIQDFFEVSARYKRKLLTWACGLFFAGVVSAALASIT